MDGPVHSRHFRDGYPLCWPMDREGQFFGSFKDDEVTCPDCLTIISKMDYRKEEDQ